MWSGGSRSRVFMTGASGVILQGDFLQISPWFGNFCDEVKTCAAPTSDAAEVVVVVDANFLMLTATLSHPV